MKKILLLALLSIAGWAGAQTSSSIRKEYDIEDEKGHNVYTEIGNKTSLVYYYITDKRAKERIWMFDLLDENLQAVKHLEIVISTNPYNDYFYYAKDNYFHLFVFNTLKGIYEIHRILLDDLTYKTSSGKFPKPMLIQEFRVLNTTAFISGKVGRDHTIYITDISNTGEVKQVVPAKLTEAKIVYDDSEIISNVEVAYKYKACVRGEGCEYYIIRFDANGNQLGDFYIVPKPDADREIKFITMSKGTDNSYFVTGTFAAGRSKMANGLFFSKVVNGRTEFIKYYNFLDLTNFTSYLSQRQQDKIERKKDKAEEKGEEYFASYNVAIHDIVERDGEYVFVGEFYYATYRTEYYTVMGPNGTMRTQSRQVFDGYQYSHASVAGFDKQGTLTWSNTFEMWLSQKPMSVRRFIRKNFRDNVVDLIFLNGGNVKSVTFRKEKIEKEETFNIAFETDDENDKVKRSYDGDIKWWYDRHYINTGRQVIRNDEKEDKKRTVFFVNKSSY